MLLLIFSHTYLYKCLFSSSPFSLALQMWMNLRTAMKPFGYLILFYFGKYEKQSTIKKRKRKKCFLHGFLNMWVCVISEKWRYGRHKCLIHSIGTMWIGKLRPDMARHGMAWHCCILVLIFPQTILCTQWIKSGLHTAKNILKGHLYRRRFISVLKLVGRSIDRL